MRWIRLNCILLASIAILSTAKAESSRHKRDLSLVKNFIKTAIYGRENKTEPELVLVSKDENYKIFRIPGFDNILVKAVPKVAGTVAAPEKVDAVSSDSKVGIVASYLGTKTQSETLNALQGIKTLLGSGVLTATKDQVAPVDTLPPHLQLIAVGEGTFEKPHILLDTSNICDEVQADEKPIVVQQPTIWPGHPFLPIFQRPIKFPTIFKPISPVKVPVPAVSTKYSYKQIHGDGKVTTYTADDDQHVMVTQSDRPIPLPPVVTYRIQEVMNLGAHGIQGLATIPVFAGNIQRPVQYFTSPKVNPYRPVGNDYSYKQIHNGGSVTSYSSGQKGADVFVTEVGRVPTIPAFITDRIEKVAATAATGKEPNPVVLSGLNVAQAQWYNPLVYQQADTKGGVQVHAHAQKQDNKIEQNVNTGSKGTYSYQTIYKDGSVTNYGGDSSVSSKLETKPISPVFIEDRLQTITKSSGGSFSYKILHNDGSVTNYGVFGVRESNGESKIVPVQTTKPTIKPQANFISGNKGQTQLAQQQSQPDIKSTGSGAGYNYKRIHSDGSVTSYSSSGVVEENRKGPVTELRGDDLEMTNTGYLHINLNNQQNEGKFSHVSQQKNEQQASSAVNYAKHKHAPQIGTTSTGSFTYKAVHNDGSATIYTQNRVKKINEQPSFRDQNKWQQSVSSFGTSAQSEQNDQDEKQIDAEVAINNQDMKHDNQVSSQNNAVPNIGSFSYTAIHNDGSSTVYSQNEVRDKNAPLKIENKPSHMSISQTGSSKHVQESAESYTSNDQAAKQNIELSSHIPTLVGSGSGPFSYKRIHNDGSTTIYSQNGVKEENSPLKNENKSSMVNERQPENNQYVEGSTQSFSSNTQAEKQNIQVSPQKNIKFGSGSFSYKTIHNDGSTTIYSQNGVKEENVLLKNENQPSIMSVSQPKNNQYVEEGAQNFASNDEAQKQNIQVSSQNNAMPAPGLFTYKAVHNDGSATIYSENEIKKENVAETNGNQQSSGFIGVNQQENVQKSAQNNVATATNNQAENKNIPVKSEYTTAPTPGSFSYKAVHSDGSATIYLQNGVKVENAELTNENQQSTGITDLNQSRNSQGKNIHTNAQNIVIPVPGSFSYKALHNDGSKTIYSQNGIKEETAALLNRNQQFSFDAGALNNAGAAFNEQSVEPNIQITSHNSAPGSFYYKTVHNDGSSTVYTQNGAKEDNFQFQYENPTSVAADGKQPRGDHNLHSTAQNVVVPVSGSFSYKAVHNDGSTTVYSQSGVKEETSAKESHMKDNKDYKNQSAANAVKVNMNQNLHTNQQNTGTSSSGSFSYKAIHSDGSETNYSGQSVEDIKAPGPHNPMNAKNLQYLSQENNKETEEMNVHTNPQYHGKPSGSFSYKTIHSEGSVSDLQSGSSQQNIENQDQSAASNEIKSDEQKSNQIIPPAPELPELSSSDLSVTPVSVLVTDSNKVLFTKPVVSSYTYKQINHHMPDQFKVAVNIAKVAAKDSQLKVAAQVAGSANINEAGNDDDISKDYVFIPPANINEPPPIKPLVPKEEGSKKIPNNAPSVVVLAPVDVVPCVENSLSKHPIVVLDEPMKYSYQQRKADGSAVHVESDQSVVSVSISPKERVKSRGDIPESP